MCLIVTKFKCLLRLSSSIAQVGQSLSVLQEALFAFEIAAGL